jgi:hypothetical protein
MARELGLNPKKFGSLANQRQEPWKVPLAEFIAALYVQRFGKTMPDQVHSLEEGTADQTQKKAAKRARAEAVQAATVKETNSSQA